MLAWVIGGVLTMAAGIIVWRAGCHDAASRAATYVVSQKAYSLRWASFCGWTLFLL